MWRPGFLVVAGLIIYFFKATIKWSKTQYVVGRSFGALCWEVLEEGLFFPPVANYQWY